MICKVCLHLSWTQLSPITPSSRVSRSNLKHEFIPGLNNKLSTLPDKAGVSRRLYSVEKQLKISNAIFLAQNMMQHTTIRCLLSFGAIGFHVSPDIETKFISRGRNSPQSHFHCWASQDSGSNSHRPNFFLIPQSLSRHNKPPVVSGFQSTRH